VADKPRVALPVAIPRAAESITREAGGDVVWSRLSSADLTRAATVSGVAFAGGREGGFMFPSFLPACDATATFVHLLAMLAQTGTPLSKVVSQLEPVHVVHERVVTPWDRRDVVVQTLVDRIHGRELVLVDGVKVLHDEGWALVLPDPDEPLTHVWAEGRNDVEARALAEEYARRVAQLIA
jgi:mannose-1-phosphate guanylyltransferase/phosphomannomutase